MQIKPPINPPRIVTSLPMSALKDEGLIPMGTVFTIAGLYWPLTWRQRLVNLWRVYVLQKPKLRRRLQEHLVTRTVNSGDSYLEYRKVFAPPKDSDYMRDK